MSNLLVATHVLINGVNMSGFITSNDFPEMSDMHDDAVMTDTAHSSRPGLDDCNCSIEGLQSFESGGPDETLVACKALGATGFPIVWKPNSGTTAATNPSRTATFVLESYTPISGQRGALATFKATFKPGGSAPNVVRTTAP